MSIVTLLTDWHRDGYYQSAVKGKLLSLLPGLQIVDISHQLPSFDYVQAAFILRGSFRTFPLGTVHLVGVNSEAMPGKPHIAISQYGQFFIGADNGIFGMVFGENPEKVHLLEHSAITTFPEYDVFADAAVFLAGGGNISQLGPEQDKLYMPGPIRPVMLESSIDGGVLHIDAYRNIISNITSENFKLVGRNRRFEILVNSNYNKITTISTHYYEAGPGGLLALFNAAGYLEIAINMGFAADLLSLDKNAKIRVKFFDKPEREELKLL